MKHVVFVNCRDCDFIGLFLSGEKTVETRNRNTLARFLGETIYLAETGHGRPVVRCRCRISSITEVFTPDAYRSFCRFHAVPETSRYYWHPDTKKKVFYSLTEVEPVEPFTVTDGTRHGRIYIDVPDEKEEV